MHSTGKPGAGAKKRLTPDELRKCVIAVLEDYKRALVDGGYYEVINVPCPVQIRRGLTYPLYRYTKRCWADDFFQTGKIRLAPVLEYRDTVNFNEAVGDGTEGITNFLTDKPGLPCGLSMAIQNQLTISCTEVRDDTYMMEAFGYDCVFSINSVEFFLAINAAVADICSSCLIDRVVYTRPKHHHSLDMKLDEMEGQPIFAGLYKDEKYHKQREVRPLWEVKGFGEMEWLMEPRDELERWQKEYIAREIARVPARFINVPEAARHCTLLG
jgi:hypothetical protein